MLVKQYREEAFSASALSATAFSNEFRAVVWEIGSVPSSPPPPLSLLFAPQNRLKGLGVSSLWPLVVCSLFLSTDRGLEHPNLIMLRGMCADPLCLLAEHVEGPSLDAFLAAPASHPSLGSLDWKFRVKARTLPLPPPPIQPASQRGGLIFLGGDRSRQTWHGQ